MQCTGSLDEVDEELGCVCLWWRTDNNKDPTGWFGEQGGELKVAEWLCIKTFFSINRSVNAMRGS